MMQRLKDNFSRAFEDLSFFFNGVFEAALTFGVALTLLCLSFAIPATLIYLILWGGF